MIRALWITLSPSYDAPRRRLCKGLGRGLAIVALGATLAACSAPVRQTALVPQVDGDSRLVGAESPIHRAIAVGPVQASQESNPFDGAIVTASDLRRSLETALELRDLFGGEDGAYSLEATIEEIAQPSVQVNFEVTATVFYRVRLRESGAIVYEERVTTQNTASVLETIVRSERIRIATEGAMKNNIAAFLDRLATRARRNPAAFQPG